MKERETDISEFVKLCIEWEALPLATPAAVANALSDRIWAYGENLRELPEGRHALEEFAATHASPGVRLKAATICLRWAPDIAVPSLTEILQGQGPEYGMLPALAYVLLEMHRSGTLFPGEVGI